jgi:N-acetylglucosaminyl-diphospho-decaprenol L-rhamnosyltransferase
VSAPEPSTSLEGLSRVAVLVVNYNTADVLARCLATLAPGVDAGMEVVVVDNGSADASVAVVRRDFPRVRLVESGANLGFGAGVNRAAMETTREDLLVLNPDCFIEPAAIAILASRLDAGPELGFVGPRIDLSSGEVDHAALRADPDIVGAVLYFSRLPRLFPASAAVNRYSLAHADYDEEQELLAGTAGCLMFRAAAFRAVGGFDEAFFMYGEDLDLCRRLREAGWAGRYVPSAHALHLKGEASRKQSNRMLVEFHRAMWTYYEKHERSGHPAPVNWAVASGIATLAGARLAVNAFRREGRVSRR